jgi:fructosamine-3-kinase
VAGGCISPCARIARTDGDVAFLKWTDDAKTPDHFFRAEAEGLERLGAAGAVRVPSVLAVGDRWLLLEWLEPGAATDAVWERLGGELAALHRVRAEAFGAAEDNFIGSLPQANGWSASWPEFWRERRLLPCYREAYEAGHFGPRDRARFDALLDRMEQALDDVASEGPSLLHGDLWNGNVHPLRDGGAALIDPSCYYGHRDVDLAMAELFGGFGRRFFDAYDDAWPRAEGYRDVRRPIYQLYYLLVHVVLFGAAYVAGSRSAVESALAELRA